MTLSKYQCLFKFLFLFVFQYGLSQSDTEVLNEKIETKFSFSVISFNHAEQVYTGILSYSLISDNLLVVSKNDMYSKNTYVLLKKRLDKNVLDKLRNIPLENLNGLYFNKCIMSTSGNEYIITITKGMVNKTILIHHYYIQIVEQFIDELNNYLVGNVKINYVTNGTKQDCD